MTSAYKDFGSALLAYRDRPEGPIEPIQTNWCVVAANDNADPEETADFSFERNLLVTPSVQEILRQATFPVERNEAGQIVRIGRLSFSDGAQREKGYALGPDDKVIQADFRMPIGAMLGTVEKAKQQAGGKDYTNAELEQSNLYFSRVLKTIEPRYVPRKKRKNGPSLTASQSRSILAEAIANTPVMPKVKKLKPGLPCGSSRVADSFVGMQKGKKGETGAMMWQDMCTSIVNREIWDETLTALKKEDRETLDKAMVAGSFAEIGVAAGQSRLYADKRGGGRKRLMAANDNLTIELKKSAA
ncbi:hypothetical protein [Mesorhizobium sp. DCY119]|uniref:hypothetical protein n=1 Tax=Mesorhizobium sp. DCY119 TaxID=2108445 RepID=UPI000E6CC5F7|nr:hypothetical protein [Mesorhizobium sp. DCY119]RJG46517.1 hypothetical protein D3Y55_21220 [Mesorhizobium sp. DCY119]